MRLSTSSTATIRSFSLSAYLFFFSFFLVWNTYTNAYVVTAPTKPSTMMQPPQVTDRLSQRLQQQQRQQQQQQRTQQKQQRPQRQSYSLGLGKNQPVPSIGSKYEPMSSSSLSLSSSLRHGNLNFPWVAAYESVREYPSPLLRGTSPPTERQPAESSLTTTKVLQRTNLPQIQWNNHPEVDIMYPPQDPWQETGAVPVPAIAVPSNEFDLNTAWVELLIAEQQQLVNTK